MNRNLITLMTALFILTLASLAVAQDFGPGHGVGEFIDENGDGFNDLAPDADGDGIPNGLDEDYVKPEDGTGNMYRFGKDNEMGGKMFGFAKGEGMGEGLGQGNHYGPGDGTGTGVGPADGTGFGPGTGSGDCPEGDTDSSGAIQRRGNRR